MKKQRFVITESKKKRDNNNLFESAIDNNHHLLNQSMPLPAVLNEIFSPLTDIFEANTSLLSKLFYDSRKKKDFLGSPNIL